MLVFLSLLNRTYGFALFMAIPACIFLLIFVNGIRYYIIGGDEFRIEGVFGNKISAVLFDDMVKIYTLKTTHEFSIGSRGFSGGSIADSYEGLVLKIQMKSGEILKIDMEKVWSYNELGEALKEKLGEHRFE
jgi:hypothetical protein